MQVYKVKHNQNIFDVAIAVHGAVEGVFDLLVNNPELSFDTILEVEQELYWDEDIVVYDSIVESLAQNNIIPANGERHVYYKDIAKELRCVIQVDSENSSIVLQMSGDGVVTVDWGDNTELEDIVLQPIIQSYTHYFDNATNCRVIKLYGDFNIKTWVLSPINGLIMPTMPLIVDEVEIEKNKVSLQGLLLFSGTYSIKMSNISILDLSPIQNMSLSCLDLLNIDYASDKILDDYLIYVAKHNNQRRNCVVTIDKMPSGVYQEPAKDSSGNYIITSGMEAVYVITHEIAWNEAGPWIFNICGTVYQYNNDDIA